MISGADLEAFDYYDEPNNTKPVSEMVEEYRTTAGQKKDPHLMASLIQEEYEEWFNCNVCFQDFYEEELKELADLVYVVYGYATSRGWNLEEAVRRVHGNNIGRMFQEDGTIKRREDGKVIKQPGYPKVNLGDLV